MHKSYLALLLLALIATTSWGQVYLNYSVNQPPALSAHAGNDQLICPGGQTDIGALPAAIGGYGGYQYQWSPGTNLNNAQIGNPIAFPSTSTTYILTVTDSLGQSSSADYAITVTAVVPTVAISASSTTVTAGRSVSLDGSASAAPSGRTIASCQWALTSGSSIAAFSGATNDCASAIVNATAAGSFTVQLTVVDSAGAEASRSVTITATAATVSSDSSSNSGGSAGGGAMSGLWLAALAAAALALWRRSR